MDITITGKQLDVTESLKDYVRKKIGKLEKYFDQLLDSHIVLAVEKLEHFAEATIKGDSVVFHAEVRTEDMYASIDNLFDKMDKQIRRYKEKHSGHKVTPLKHMEPKLKNGAELDLAIQISEADNKYCSSG
jgi:putative sigma-54 modulation protein